MYRLGKPRIVLWFYFEGNDLTDLQRERQSMLLRNYLDDGFAQSALSRQADLDRAIANELPRLRALEEHNRLQRQNNQLAGTLTSLATYRFYAGGLDWWAEWTRPNESCRPTCRPPTWRHSVTSCARPSGGSMGGAGSSISSICPNGRAIRGYTSWGISERDGVLESVRDLGIPLVDLDATFRAYGDPLSLFPFRAVGHYNETGHQAVAAEVLKAIAGRETPKPGSGSDSR